MFFYTFIMCFSFQAISSDHTFRKCFSFFLATSRSRRLRWPQDIGTTWSAYSKGNVDMKRWELGNHKSWEFGPCAWNSKVLLLDDEMFILLKFESYWILSPVGVQNTTARLEALEELSNNTQLNLPALTCPDYSQPTSPWKKCTGVAGSSAGSLLPTKELSTNTAPQDGSSSTQSRDDVKDSNSQRQKTRWWLGKWSTLFSASMLDLKAVKPWISMVAKFHDPSYILTTSKSNLPDRFHSQLIRSPPSASCEVPVPKAASKTTAPPWEKPANTTRSELRPASNCSWGVLIHGKGWWNFGCTRSCSFRLVLHAHTPKWNNMKRVDCRWLSPGTAVNIIHFHIFARKRRYVRYHPQTSYKQFWNGGRLLHQLSHVACALLPPAWVLGSPTLWLLMEWASTGKIFQSLDAEVPIDRNTSFNIKSYKIHFLNSSILGPSKQNPKFIPKHPKSSQLLIFSQPPPTPNKKTTKNYEPWNPNSSGENCFRENSWTAIWSFSPGGFNLKSSGSNELMSNQLGIDMPMFTVTRLIETSSKKKEQESYTMQSCFLLVEVLGKDLFGETQLTTNGSY